MVNNSLVILPGLQTDVTGSIIILLLETLQKTLSYFLTSCKIVYHFQFNKTNWTENKRDF